MTVLGWAAVVLNALHNPGHALVQLSLRQVLLLLELFKYQRKALVLNCLVFSHGETSAELSKSWLRPAKKVFSVSSFWGVELELLQ